MFINFFFGTKLKQMDQIYVSREFDILSIDNELYYTRYHNLTFLTVEYRHRTLMRIARSLIKIIERFQLINRVVSNDVCFFTHI